jgi:hypothetical protein
MIRRRCDEVSKVLPFQLKCGTLLYCMGIFLSRINAKAIVERYPLRFDIKGCQTLNQGVLPVEQRKPVDIRPQLSLISSESVSPLVLTKLLLRRHKVGSGVQKTTKVHLAGASNYLAGMSTRGNIDSEPEENSLHAPPPSLEWPVRATREPVEPDADVFCSREMDSREGFYKCGQEVNLSGMNDAIEVESQEENRNKAMLIDTVEFAGEQLELEENALLTDLPLITSASGRPRDGMNFLIRFYDYKLKQFANKNND